MRLQTSNAQNVVGKRKVPILMKIMIVHVPQRQTTATDEDEQVEYYTIVSRCRKLCEIKSQTDLLQVFLPPHAYCICLKPESDSMPAQSRGILYLTVQSKKVVVYQNSGCGNRIILGRGENGGLSQTERAHLVYHTGCASKVA